MFGGSSELHVLHWFSVFGPKSASVAGSSPWCSRLQTTIIAGFCGRARQLLHLSSAVLPLLTVKGQSYARVMVSEGEKLSKLRAFFDDAQIVATHGRPIEAYLLPRTDAHQNEYLSPRDSRIHFLSGFAGSNAFVVVTKKKALLWTDGRYFLQAKAELEPGWTLMEEGLPHSVAPADWLIANLADSAVVAFDPQLYGYADGRKLQNSLGQSGITAVPLKQNLVDAIWNDRPAETVRMVIALNSSEYGVESEAKIEDVRKKLVAKKCGAAIFTSLDDIAWLFNFRGADIPFNPVVFAVAVLTATESHLFIDTRKLSDKVRRHLAGVHIHEYDMAIEWITKWYAGLSNKTEQHKIYVPDSTNFELGSLLKEEHCVYGLSPIQSMKSVKNDTELRGMRKSHLSAAEQICKMRAKMPGFVGPSFETISAVNDHAALPHYKPTEESGVREVTKDCLYLIDSGGHYRDGTTDVTRTVVFDVHVDEDIKRAFTVVLKGHISTAQTIFPDATHGIRIDVLARQYLWNDGLDFGHGVGHGVGHFLNVHEGPVGIGFRRYTPDGAIHERMVITIEPGFYSEGRWGIRIENCYETVKAMSLRSGAENFLTFESLTYVPLQKCLIQKELLSQKEIDWLDDYHKKCFEKVSPFLEEFGWKEESEWLAEACSPL